MGWGQNFTKELDGLKLSARELDDKRDDDRGDYGEPSEGARVDVDLTKALVTSVAAQPADRLAATSLCRQIAAPRHDPAQRGRGPAG